jgi:uncharacterized protein
MKPINLRIAKNCASASRRSLLPSRCSNGGAMVPFVARYRNEATGALDDAQLRTLEERLSLRNAEVRAGVL